MEVMKKSFDGHCNITSMAIKREREREGLVCVCFWVNFEFAIGEREEEEEKRFYKEGKANGVGDAIGII